MGQDMLHYVRDINDRRRPLLERFVQAVRDKSISPVDLTVHVDLNALPFRDILIELDRLVVR
jgi:hypothetical protein